LQQKNYFDIIIVGSGAAGMVAAITAARDSKKVLLLEKLPKIGAKLKATGGGRCNLTNTLSNEEFMLRFGRDGRFMTQALREFDYKKLINFFEEIGVKSHAPDGFRVFPITHNSNTVLDALKTEMLRLHVKILCNERVEKLLHVNAKIEGVKTQNSSFYAPNIIIATGGLGYPQLGAEGDGYKLAVDVGHRLSELSPAMMPLTTKETWVKNCKADTISKVELRVNLAKAKKLRAKGALIFTSKGIRGPVVLDFAREITPLLKKYNEVPLLVNLCKGKNEEDIRAHFKNEISKNPHQSILELVKTLLPNNLSSELCKICKIDTKLGFSKIEAIKRDKLIKILAWTPLTITGHDGFKMAMITRGGVSLKEIDPNTMQSRLIDGLYFCGEVMNLDGPCGGYNLQWSFASGYLAGKMSSYR
jgi:predicted Rossmann fold flavoprotein